MSAPDAHLELLTGAADIVELACHRGREAELRQLAASRSRELPSFGRASTGGGGLAVCVRPGRWLLFQPKRANASGASEWAAGCGDLGTAVDLSAGLSLLALRGPMAFGLLDRHCRLDLRRECFEPGSAAASQLAQVAIIIVARADGLLLATPLSTSRHLLEWLLAAGRPFGLGPLRGVTTEELLGD